MRHVWVVVGTCDGTDVRDVETWLVRAFDDETEAKVYAQCADTAAEQEHERHRLNKNFPRCGETTWDPEHTCDGFDRAEYHVVKVPINRGESRHG